MPVTGLRVYRYTVAMNMAERETLRRAGGDSSARPVIITIDGPAGTGKSTVARELAARLGLEFLDTGAMYRAAALIAIERGIDPADGTALAEAVREADMHFDWSADPPRLMLGERDISDAIRSLTVSGVVSTVASQTAVRRVLVEQQRAIAAAHPRLVSEGRDQGSVVFPDAPVHFFLEADVTVRAGRRAEQLASSGEPVDRQRVVEDIKSRDRLDASRRDGPLMKPDDAIVVDTTRKSVQEVVDAMENHVRRAVPDGRWRDA